MTAIAWAVTKTALTTKIAAAATGFGIFLTIFGFLFSEIMRVTDWYKVHRCSVSTPAHVVSIQRVRGNKYTATYQYRGLDKSEEPYIDTRPFNKQEFSIQIGDTFRILFDPTDPEINYAPMLDNPRRTSFQTHLVSQLLKLLILGELLLIAYLT